MKKLMMGVCAVVVAAAVGGCCRSCESGGDTGKTITVKGVGAVSVKPDYVELSIGISGSAYKYEAALEKANKSAVLVQKAAVKLGFKETDLKTLNFNIREKKSYNSKLGKDIFEGYRCSYDFKLGFDFDMKKLSEIMTRFSKCGANPDLAISFTVKDKTAISNELLASATKDAKRKAEILVDSANAKLCELVSIDYDWSEISFVSRSRFSRGIEHLRMCAAPAPDITPDNIRASDTATFVWRIESK